MQGSTSDEGHDKRKIQLCVIIHVLHTHTDQYYTAQRYHEDNTVEVGNVCLSLGVYSYSFTHDKMLCAYQTAAGRVTLRLLARQTGSARMEVAVKHFTKYRDMISHNEDSAEMINLLANQEKIN